MKRICHYRSNKEQIIGEYHKQLYVNRFEDVNKMCKFLEKYSLSKWAEEETDI